jgi:hypothetical protein
LWGWWTGNRPQEDLAKLGYRSHRKVDIFGYLTIFLQHARSSSLNLTISPFIPSKYGDVGRNFQEKTFVWKITKSLKTDWGWNRGYKSQGTQFLSLMATSNWGWDMEYKSQATQHYSPKTGWCNRKTIYLYAKLFGTLKKAPGVLHNKYPKELLETCRERKRCLWLWIHCTADLQERMPFQKLCHVHKPIMKVGKISKPRMKVRKNYVCKELHMIDITNINLYNYTRKFELIYMSSGIKI